MVAKIKTHCSFCNSEIERVKTKSGHSFCNNTCKSNWQILQREKLGFTKEWLIDQYFNLKKDCNQIAKEIGRDGKSVWNWFRGYGIEINKRGTDWEKRLDLTGKSWIGRSHKDVTKDKIKKARLEDGHVPYLKDGVHWLQTTGKENHPMWKGGITADRQALYSSPEWSEAVKEVWKRDNATCQRCSKHHNTVESRGTFHIHHIISFQNVATRATVPNLILLCKDCHIWVHSKKNIKKLFIK